MATVTQTPAIAQTYLVKLLDLDLDSLHGTSTSDQFYMDALHKAARRVYQWAEFYYGKVTFSPAENGQQFALKDAVSPTAVKFGAQMDEIEFVWYNDFRLYYSGIPGLYPWLEFEDAFPTWDGATAGAPSAASVSPDNLLTLDKPLSAAAISTGGFKVSGKGHPNIVDASNSTVYSTNAWAVHPDLQDAVLKEAAVILGEALASSPGAVSRIQEYRRSAFADALKWREESQRRLSSPPTGSAYRLGGSFDTGGFSW